MKKNQVGSAIVKKMRWLNRSLLAFAALVACVGGIAGRASAQTVGWWGFEGVPGQTARIGTVFPNRVDSSRLPAEVYARYEGTASMDYQPVFSNPIFEPYGMGDTTTSFASHSALRFANSYADASRSQGCPVRIQDVDGALDLQTFTLEGWFKMDPGGYVGWRALFSKGYGSNGAGGDAYTFALYVSGSNATNQKFYANFCTKGENGGFVSLEQKTLKDVAFRDGKWHYVSLVVNGTAHKAHLFVDLNPSGEPVWRGEIDLGADLVYNRDEPLVLGGNNLASWQYCGEIDEVRLSDKTINTEADALRKRGIPDGTVIGHFHLENDCRSSVWADYWPEAELSAAAGGTVPTLVAIGERKCLCDVNGVRVDNLVDTNCLNISGGKVQWTDPQLLKDSVDSLTIEFFVNGKAEENADWAGIVRADYTSTKLYLPFNLSHHKMSGSYNLVCRVDTDRNYNENTKNASIPLDGKWHHVAIQLERQTDTDGNKVTSLILCVDYNYENRREMSVSGWIQYPSGTHFGFGLASTPFKGMIDELRLTKGILPPDKFLRLRDADGLILVVR